MQSGPSAYEYLVESTICGRHIRLWIHVPLEDIYKITNKDRDALQSQLESYAQSQKKEYWLRNDFILAEDICKALKGSTCQVGNTSKTSSSIYYMQWP